MNTILEWCDREGVNRLAVSSSGIAALLLKGGETAHSAFGIPLEIGPKMRCNWLLSDHRAKKLLPIELIIWDEIGMAHRYAILAVDEFLRELRRDDKPFGGCSVIFAGDFRQILPVIQGGSLADQSTSC